MTYSNDSTMSAGPIQLSVVSDWALSRLTGAVSRFAKEESRAWRKPCEDSRATARRDWNFHNPAKFGAIKHEHSVIRRCARWMALARMKRGLAAIKRD